MPTKPTPRGVIALATILTAGLLTVTGASAGDAVSCGLYAGSAVAQQQENVANGCGFSGPRWHNNHGAHFA